MNESTVKPVSAAETTLWQDVVALVRYGLRGRRGWLLLGLAVVGGGLWFGWPSLVAAGAAPLLLSVLPCVAMCALGLCMKGGGQSCDSGQDAAPGASTTTETAADTARPNLTDER